MSRWRSVTTRIVLLFLSLGAIGIASNAVFATSYVASPDRAPTPTVARADDALGPGTLAIVRAPALHVRNGPGVTFDVIGKLFTGDSVVIIEQDTTGMWLRVRVPRGIVGWVSRAGIRCCESSDDLSDHISSVRPTLSPPAAPTISHSAPEPLQKDQARADESWFKVQPDVAAAWTLTQDGRWTWTLVQRDPATAGTRAKNLLVLYTKGSSAYDTAISTILTVFQTKQLRANFTVINTRGELAAGQQAIAQASAKSFDLIFAMGSDATAFLTEHVPHSSIPVVSVSAKDPVLLGQMRDYATGSGTNFAYTSLNVPIAVQMAYLHELKPHLKNIAVLYAASNGSALQTQVKPLQQIAATYNIRVIDVVVNDDTQARAELAAKVPAAIAEIAKTDPSYADSIVWITGSTSVFTEIHTINEHAGVVPVLSAVPDVVQEGDNSAVLSIGVSFQSNAHLAAVYAADILAGSVRAGDLKVGTVSPPDIAINFRRARAIGLKIPFRFFESASFVYDSAGTLVRKEGQVIRGP